MLKIVCSSVADGSMKSTDGQWQTVLKSRTTFLQKYGLQPINSVLVHLNYSGGDFTRYITVDQSSRGDGIVRKSSMIADGIATQQKDLVLFLPLADCAGLILYDSTNNTLMLSHLGRHNIEQYSGIKSVEYLIEQFNCDPKNITAWLSPAAGQKNYPLHHFNNRGIHETIITQLQKVGIQNSNITASQEDTTTSEKYFSHSEFLKGNRQTDGRFAVAACMSTDQ